MRISHISSGYPGLKAGLVFLLHMQGEKAPKEAERLLRGVKEERYAGKLLQTYACDTGSKEGARHLVIVGLGKKGEFRLDNLRRAAGLAVRYAGARREKEAAIFLPPDLPLPKGMGGGKAAQALCEGALLAGYKFTEFKTKRDELFDVERVTMAGLGKEAEEGIRLGTIMAGAQNYARSLDDQPANVASPQKVAEWAKKLAKEEGLEIEIFDAARMKRMGMNALLAVAEGSANKPLLVRLDYNKGKKLPLYCVVGKGVTFDSGGISIKPSANMHEMKYDKTGAINVLGVMMAVSRLGLPIRVIGLMPLVENMPSGTAQRPGDIVRAYNGKTIEVLNTDAEGRLILADALAYAAEQKPEGIIDMATLTGAMIISLGRHAIGMFSNDERLAGALAGAGEDTHERVWRLPVWPEYGEMIKADFADIKNISEQGEAGSITAAMFRKEFVGEAKWAHLDIAAVDFVKWPHPYLEKSASGTGVRLVAAALSGLAKKK
jgi:leucyl aminopeptidase